MLDLLVVELQNTIEDADFVISQGLLSLTVESEERLEFCFLVRVSLVVAEDVVEKLGNGPCNRCYYGERENGWSVKKAGDDLPNMYIMARTMGAHDAPIDRP